MLEVRRLVGNHDVLFDETPLKVFFVGNSFTARNDLPGLIAGLAAARGKILEHRLISAGGEERPAGRE